MSAAVRDSHHPMEGPIFPDERDPTHLSTDEKRAPEQTIPVYNELELISETDLSLGSILKGTAANPLTNFERKAALVNAYVLAAG